MSAKKISELAVASTLDGTELVEASQSSGGVLGSVQTTTEDVAYAAAKYAIVYDVSDQPLTANTATVVEFDTPGLLEGITLVSSTQVTFASPGVYEITARLQLANSSSTDYSAKVWFRLSGTDIVNSATTISVPKLADGGAASFAITGLVSVTAGQYLQVVISAANAAISIEHTAATTSPYVSPVTPSAILTAKRIAL